MGSKTKWLLISLGLGVFLNTSVVGREQAGRGTSFCAQLEAVSWTTVFLWRVQGAAPELIPDALGGPALSRDRRKAAFISDRGGEPQIWVVNCNDGRQPTQLTTKGHNMVPTWSPDGKQIAFTSDRTGHLEIWAMGADGSNQRQLTHTAADMANAAATWSADGKRIAFIRAKGREAFVMGQGSDWAIWVMDADGSNTKRLTTPYGDRYPHANVPAWSPDGTKIAFWSGRENIGYGNVWVMDADGSNRKQLTNQPPGTNCDGPSWSPDGSQIVFGSNRPGSEGLAVWIMEADGSNQRVLKKGIISAEGMRMAKAKQQGRPQTSLSASLERKMGCFRGGVQKWDKEGKKLEPIDEIMQGFQPLADQQKFAEAERLLDQALKVLGASCP